MVTLYVDSTMYYTVVKEGRALTSESDPASFIINISRASSVPAPTPSAQQPDRLGRRRRGRVGHGGRAERGARRRGGRVEGSGGGGHGRGRPRHHLLAHLPDLELQADLAREGLGVLQLERGRRLCVGSVSPSVYDYTVRFNGFN